MRSGGAVAYYPFATERPVGIRAKECSAISANVIATCFALVGFTAAIVVGWAAGNTTDVILWRALTALLICAVAGKVVGLVAQRTIEENIEAYKRENPIPADPMLEPAAAQPPAPADAAEQNVTSRSAA